MPKAIMITFNDESLPGGTGKEVHLVAAMNLEKENETGKRTVFANFTGAVTDRYCDPVYLVYPDNTVWDYGGLNEILDAFGPVFVPHGSNGFEYTNKTHKLGIDRGTGCAVLTEHADKAVLLLKDGTPVEETEKLDVTIKTMYKFNAEGKVQAMMYEYDKDYMELCKEEAGKYRPAPDNFMQMMADLGDLGLCEPPDLSVFEPIEVKPATVTTTTETLMPDGSVKVTVERDGVRTEFLKSDIARVKEQYNASESDQQAVDDC